MNELNAAHVQSSSKRLQLSFSIHSVDMCVFVCVFTLGCDTQCPLHKLQ